MSRDDLRAAKRAVGAATRRVLDAYADQHATAGSANASQPDYTTRQLQAEHERLLARQAEWQRAQTQSAGLEAWCRDAAGRIAGADFARRRELLALLDVRVSVYRQDHTPRYVADARLPFYVDGSDDPIWRRETVQMSDGAWSGETVQMKVCIFQGYDDPDNAEIIATFFTDPSGTVHVDNEAFYDTVRGIRDPASGRRLSGHDGIAFLHAVRNYFRGPGVWAGEVVPLFPRTED